MLLQRGRESNGPGAADEERRKLREQRVRGGQINSQTYSESAEACHGPDDQIWTVSTKTMQPKLTTCHIRPGTYNSVTDLYSFDPAHMTWTLLCPLRTTSSADMNWTLLSGGVSAVDDVKCPSARASHGFTSMGRLLYVHGGSSIPSNNIISLAGEGQALTYSNELHSFDLANMTWVLLSSADDTNCPSARASHGFTSSGGRLYVHGGLSKSQYQGVV
jgi:hypothetical protein